MKKVFIITIFLGLLFTFFLFDSHAFVHTNSNLVKSSFIDVYPISYDSKILYTSSLSYGEESIKQDGVLGYGVSGTDEILVSPVDEIKEVGLTYLDSFYGSTTGYGSDCLGCSGIVACSTSYGSHNLISDGVYYDDSTFGNVRIVAADNSLFSCGTILKIDDSNSDPFYAIVLDTGSAMRDAWRVYGDILIDIAFSYEDSSGVSEATNKSGNVNFKVYRYGW